MAIDPTPEQFSALARSGHEGPLQMVNLLQFRPDGGREEYARYAEAAGPHLVAAGATVRTMTHPFAQVIGEQDRPWWDAILTVEYPSLQAFLDMVTSPAYQEITVLRTGSLVRAELIATAPGL